MGALMVTSLELHRNAVRGEQRLREAAEAARMEQEREHEEWAPRDPRFVVRKRVR